MSSGFITEAEVAEVRKKRQEEWDRVRKPSDPVERPEEPIDNRSLFDRLQEQKQKKDLEYEEAHKLKNMIKGLDDDEIEFLDLVDRTKLAADRKKEIEEEQELSDYRNRVAILQEKSLEHKLHAEISVTKPKVSSGGKLNQQKLLKGVVVKKSVPVKRKMSDNEENLENSGDKEDTSPKQPKIAPAMAGQGDVTSTEDLKVVPGSALKCVAVLPGLGCYENSSSDESTSDSDSSEIESTTRTDLLGRKVIEVSKDSVIEQKK